MNSGAILLTGATGFLGRYLLRELLATGRPVLVLVRDSRGNSAAERVRELVAFGSESLGRQLAQPTVLVGDLKQIGLGLDASDRTRVARCCQTAVHSAACVTLRASPSGEPWRTNVEGTQQLLELLQKFGARELHHVSTAFVSGDRTSEIREDDLDCGQNFHNDYERSKWEAERRIRRAAGLRVTIYRPSVIVGDSITGHTSSYHGFYRFLDMADRLAERMASGRRSLTLRVPYTGNEPRNLVPVDWVARAIARIVARPDLHGRTYHLTSSDPVPARIVRDVAEELLKIDGVSWVGSVDQAERPSLEETFLDHLEEYWPYLAGDPVFDCRNTRTALPDLPCPRVDRVLLERLIRFAVADRWGRASRRKAHRRAWLDCADYIECFFPESARRSAVVRVPVAITLGLVIRGPGGGSWTCRLLPGAAPEVERGRVSEAGVVYRMDVSTFESVVRGRRSPQEAFFERKIEIEGNVERALKLATLFEHFVRECPYSHRKHQETEYAAGVPA